MSTAMLRARINTLAPLRQIEEPPLSLRSALDVPCRRHGVVSHRLVPRAIGTTAGLQSKTRDHVIRHSQLEVSRSVDGAESDCTRSVAVQSVVVRPELLAVRRLRDPGLWHRRPSCRVRGDDAHQRSGRTRKETRGRRVVGDIETESELLGHVPVRAGLDALLQ